MYQAEPLVGVLHDIGLVNEGHSYITFWSDNFAPLEKQWLYQGFLTPSKATASSYPRWFAEHIDNTSGLCGLTGGDAGQSYDAVRLFAYGVQHLLKLGKDINAPGALMKAFKAVQFPSVVSSPYVSISEDGELDVPYYLYNYIHHFRFSNASSDCPPGKACTSEERSLRKGWKVVGQMVNGTLQLEGPVRGCECNGFSDSDGRGASCQLWSSDVGTTWCYVDPTCSDSNIRWTWGGAALQYPFLWVRK